MHNRFLYLFPFLLCLCLSLSASPSLYIPKAAPDIPSASVEMMHIDSHKLPHADDFQPSIHLAWDEQQLIFKIEVVDDSLMAVPDKLWEGDSVEVFIAPHKGAVESVQYIFGLPESGDEVITKIIDKRTDKAVELTTESHFTRQDNGYAISLSLPLEQAAIPLRDTSTFALQVKISDRDPGEGKATVALLYERPGAYNNTNRMLEAELTLEKASQQHTLRTAEWQTSEKYWEALLTAPPQYTGQDIEVTLDDGNVLKTRFFRSQNGWAEAILRGPIDALPDHLTQATIQDTQQQPVSLNPLSLPPRSFFEALYAVNEADDFYLKRHQYGQPLEPHNHTIHGAGQSRDAYKDYSDALDQSTQPKIYMTYRGLKNPVPEKWTNRIKENIAPYKENGLILQIGIAMTKDGSPWEHYEQEVAEGQYDENLKLLFAFLKELDIPVMIRIGYEFNGSWNGYEPDSYKRAFRHVTNVIRESGLDAATVWCFAAKGDHNYMDFYPGDEYVDWWAIDLFEPHELTHPVTFQFLEDAHNHARPVLIGESTAKFVGTTNADEAWSHWFAPYFALIRSTPGMKAFCYINWDWAKYPMWSDWGDCRIEVNENLLKRYQQELHHPLYLHAE